MPESLRFSLLYVTAFLSYRGTSYESISTEKKVCALIPARLNSVRFPGKALKQIDGIPMVVRVPAAARDSGVFDAVYAATDSPEIAAVCQTYGFEAVFRLPIPIRTDLPHSGGGDDSGRFQVYFFAEI